MLKITKTKSFFNKIDKHFHLDGEIKSYFKLFRLMFFIFLVAHILVSIFRRIFFYIGLHLVYSGKILLKLLWR